MINRQLLSDCPDGALGDIESFRKFVRSRLILLAGRQTGGNGLVPSLLSTSRTPARLIGSERKHDMKKCLWAVILALPMFAVSPQKAWAFGPYYGPCWAMHGASAVKSLLGGDCSCACSCGPCGGFNECCGIVPGPWYLYWPQGCPPVMAAPYYGCWSYANHFQSPAPVGWYCPPAPGSYPSYWYGR